MTPEEVTPRVKPVIECEPAEMTGLEGRGHARTQSRRRGQGPGKGRVHLRHATAGHALRQDQVLRASARQDRLYRHRPGREGPRRQSRHHRLQHAAHPHGLHEGQLSRSSGTSSVSTGTKWPPWPPPRWKRPKRPQAGQGGLRGSARLLLPGGVPGGRRHAHPRDRSAREPQPQQQDPASPLEVPGRGLWPPAKPKPRS